MSGNVHFKEAEANYEPPIKFRLWNEGTRVVEERIIAFEYDGDNMEVLTEENDRTYEDVDWDEITITYDP